MTDQKEKLGKVYRLPLFIALGVFCVSMLFLWVGHIHEVNQVLAFVGASYALICFAFLVFQIYAFVKAHVDYNEDVEKVKYDVFRAEEEEWGEKIL